MSSRPSSAPEKAGPPSTDLIAGGAPTRVQAPVAPDDIFHIRFSSGSTGRPKGIAISQRGARAAILGNTWVMSSSAPEPAPRTLQVAPLVYAGGWSVLPTLLCGGTNVVLERFDADEVLATIADKGITWMFAVPTMLRRLEHLRAPAPPALVLTELPRCSPASPLRYRRSRLVSEHTDAMVQCWGQTEAPASTTLLSRQEMRQPELWSSIGRPVPGVEFSILRRRRGPRPARTRRRRRARDPYPERGLHAARCGSRARATDSCPTAGGAPPTWVMSTRPDDCSSSVVRARRSSPAEPTSSPSRSSAPSSHTPLVSEAVVVGVPDARWGETPAAYVHVAALHADTGSIIDVMGA